MTSEIDGERQGGTRRTFLHKVGLYGAPTILAGGTLLETAVRAAASSGSEASGEQTTGSASSSSSSSSSCGTGINACGVPLTTLQGDLATLKGLALRGAAALELDIAIAALGLATTGAYWVDSYDLVAKRGVLVFAAIADAELTLTLISNPPAAVTAVIASLVSVAATLANTAISAASVSASKLAAANKAFSAGVTAGTKGQYVGAIVAYGEAWADVSL